MKGKPIMTNAIITTGQNAIAAQTLTIQPYPSADSSPVVAMLGSKGQESRRKYAESLRTITALLTGSEDSPLRWESVQPGHVPLYG